MTLRKQFRRHIHLHRIFEGLRDLSGQRCGAAENVHRPALHPVFIHESDVAVLYLDRHRNQHCVIRYFDEIRAHIEWHQVNGHLVTDHFFQVLELYGRRRLQLGELLQPVELFGLQVPVERPRPQPARFHPY